MTVFEELLDTDTERKKMLFGGETFRAIVLEEALGRERQRVVEKVFKR